MPPTGLCAQIACIWEATARKPGNVHRFQDFEDATYVDFLLSAAAVAPVLEAAPGRRVGVTVLKAVRATRQAVGSNTNLGMVLLLSPLAAVPDGENLQAGVRRVLSGLDREDARLVYEAIRLAQPGGLGHVGDQDVRYEPTARLTELMALAADRDTVARQYASGFHEVFDGVSNLCRDLEDIGNLEDAIITLHLAWMSWYPDSLIARKRGREEAEEAACRAERVFAAGWPWDPAASRAALADLDAWLRAEGHSRNPGTCADLVTACLFVALREGRIQLPPQFPWHAGTGHGC
jgi:triphosphoribosyl-dephospho-CoA synthase